MPVPEDQTDYDKQATAFVASTKLVITKTYLGHRPKFDDEVQRAVWSITLSREGRKPYTFEYGDSLNDSYVLKTFQRYAGEPVKQLDNVWRSKYLREAYRKGGGEFLYYKLIPKHPTPSDYSLLSCITKYCPSSFEEFASDYGYDTDSRKALETYLAVQKEAAAVASLFTPAELELLAEIQ